MTRKRCVLILVGVLIAVWLAGPLRLRRSLYRVTVLPSLGGALTVATDLNERGQVAGFAQTADGAFHFFLWDRHNGMQDLGRAIQADVHLNDAGQITGTTPDAAGNSLAFFWDPARGMHVLGALGGKKSIAMDLNNRGQVVGRAQVATGLWHAFVWDEATGMRDLGTLGGAGSEALSINDAGLVFGRADSATQKSQAFCWDSQEGIMTAGPAVPSGTTWYGMNHRGFAVGMEPSGQLFLWSRDTRVRRLRQVADSTIQAVINDANEIVFGATSSNALARWLRRFAVPPFRCYLWDPARGRISLDDRVPHGRGENLYMFDLNNQGCMAGAFSRGLRMRSRAVLLEPIPQRWRKLPAREKRRNR